MRWEDKRREVEEAIRQFPNVSQQVIAERCGVSQTMVSGVKQSLVKLPEPTPGQIAPLRLHILWRETDARVSHFAAMVQENQLVDEASLFSRWLTFTGIIGILLENEMDGPLPVRGRELSEKNKRLTLACGDIYRRCGRAEPPQYKKSDIDEIRDQLALINKKLAA